MRKIETIRKEYKAAMAKRSKLLHALPAEFNNHTTENLRHSDHPAAIAYIAIDDKCYELLCEARKVYGPDFVA